MEKALVKKNVPKVWSTPSFKALKKGHFLTSRKYLVEPLGRKLSLKCSIFNNLRDTDHEKISTFAKHLTIFTFFVSPKILKIEHFFFLESKDNQKIVGVTIYQ